MVNITHKNYTLRKAIATATVLVSKPETIEAIVNKTVPKGDVLEFARAATFLAVKKTSDLIPDCHPLPIEYTAVSYNISELSIEILVEVHTIYKTGVEVEAMHGASTAALVLYDMLKPIDKNVSILNIALKQKTGGKSDQKYPKDIKTAVVVCSDSLIKGEREDTSGKAIISILEEKNLEVNQYLSVPDEIDAIQEAFLNLKSQGFDFVIFTGGTGLSKRDVTPEALKIYIDKEIPGIMETARNYGQQRIPTAMLSCGIAGFSGDTLLITLPGSKKACEESLQAVFPAILHVFSVRNNEAH